MNLLWIVRGIKDYRVPVYNSLSNKKGIKLNVIYNDNFTQKNISKSLSKKIVKIPLKKELIYGPKDNNHNFANKTFKVTYVPSLYKKIKSIKPDAIIIEGFFQYSLYAYIYKLFNIKTKIILSYERTKFTERNAQKIRTFYRRFMLLFTHSVVCNGSLSKDYLLDTLKFKGKIYTGNMTVDINLLNSRVKKFKINHNKNSNKLVFLYIGLLTSRKGLIELFKVWKNFEKLYKGEIQLDIVGSGDLENQLRSYVEENSIISINFHGRVDYEQISGYLANSDVFINPTLEDNWSLVIPEAMSAELPVITTIYNGLFPELVQDSNGWVIDILDTNNTLNALKDVYINRKSLKAMGKSSYKIIKQYKPEIISKNFSDASK
jgi:glycosyltransferase involved in cell wall biosynthesis